MKEWLSENPLDNKWAVIYGNLPPETKKSQAMAFNKREEGFQFLVATDAIGMGLNLNISRVIFTNIEKFNNKGIVTLTPSQILQIAGRAGRFENDGLVNAFTSNSLNYIREWIESNLETRQVKNKKKFKSVVSEINTNNSEQKIEINIDEYQKQESDIEDEQFLAFTDIHESEKKESKYQFSDDEGEYKLVVDHKFDKNQKTIKRACLFPPLQKIEDFSNEVFIQQGVILQFSQVLKMFTDQAKIGDLYFMRDIKDYYEIACELDKVARLEDPDDMINSIKNRTIRQHMYFFCQCPIRMSRKFKKEHMSVLTDYFSELIYLKQVRLPSVKKINYALLEKDEYTEADLEQLENIHNVIEVYLW